MTFFAYEPGLVTSHNCGELVSQVTELLLIIIEELRRKHVPENLLKWTLNKSYPDFPNRV